MKKTLEHRHLELCKIRQILFTDQESTRLIKLSRGFNGEYDCYCWIIEFGNKRWYVIYDYWFNYGNRTQADFIIIADSHWSLIEVKNYDGHFKYSDGKCQLNDFAFSDDVMARMSERVRKLQRMADELNSNIKVDGAMFFINEHCTVDINDSLNFDIVTRNGIRQYLKEINAAYPGSLTDDYLTRVKHVLSKYQTESPFEPQSLSPETFDLMPKGITCRDCHSFETKVSHKTIRCSVCGSSESKSDAVARSAKQLRHLYFDKPTMMTKKNICTFMGNKINEYGVRNLLSKSFTQIGRGPSTFYDVPLDW